MSFDFDILEEKYGDIAFILLKNAPPDDWTKAELIYDTCSNDNKTAEQLTLHYFFDEAEKHYEIDNDILEKCRPVFRFLLEAFTYHNYNWKASIFTIDREGKYNIDFSY